MTEPPKFAEEQPEVGKAYKAVPVEVAGGEERVVGAEVAPKDAEVGQIDVAVEVGVAGQKVVDRRRRPQGHARRPAFECEAVQDLAQLVESAVLVERIGGRT